MASATAGIRRPPALPADIAYTSHYCEENIYLLAQAFYDQLSVREAWDIFVVFISNHTKTVALKNQKLGRDGVVVWDYHVILVVRPKAADWFAPSTPADSDVVSTMSWVYDFDSRSTNPSPWPGENRER
ncbi:uncharacterized protein STEHIDRAFT_50789 [Stereum hirsutum FP-91666 SS1]|uniref:uncharacterized protein n=1 Tax=Stereum hirsutum (strain FP-91666) TaxID=721885 RepID=UPI000440FB14|nr:uncharacterized protein STEHIDRAFT_50789 [Stereum hirsutum FP-91666 SS1]EIM90368.1 hypothetical protein STEHIDRAFT_50789 [Stereum hirsutum FP-91666 SS1]